MTTKCGEFTIPTDHLAPCHTCNSKGWDCKLKTEGGKGIDGYDFILYVTAINTRQCGDTIGRNYLKTTVHIASNVNLLFQQFETKFYIVSFTI